ncbi:transcription termination/antitermination NusG family protein [Brevundimonas sp. 2R-24]|uniref:Transcription termination/antitermination NusG family protein n=1 Tax=Peiella sedimenti TaxID=3061083 RepID=A0ABT8SRS4_9CAUL|nr:transcription termination/antitermination NusG family protein [Caulobacteraceae bacterium XZ-24]
MILRRPANDAVPHELDHFSLPEPGAIDGLTWYAAKSKPRGERKAVTQLRERGFEVWLPARTEWKRNRLTKGRERVESPLIAGYMFLGLQEGQALYFALQAESVAGVIGWGGQARTIPSGFVGMLRMRQASGEFDETDRKRDIYRPGAVVKVANDGPYRDQIGCIVKVDRRGMVQLMIHEALRWKVPVHVDDLELVTTTANAA